MNKRIFIAVNLPAEIKEKIWELFLKKLKVQGIKAVEQKNLHMTVKFIGYVSEERVHEICEKLNSLKEEKGFELEISKVGSFKNRVIWIDITKGRDELLGIINKVAVALGMPKEDSVPHLTLARNKKLRKKEFLQVMGKIKNADFKERFTVFSIDVMESKLMQKGPEYTVVKSIPLAKV